MKFLTALELTYRPIFDMGIALPDWKIIAVDLQEMNKFIPSSIRRAEIIELYHTYIDYYNSSWEDKYNLHMIAKHNVKQSIKENANINEIWYLDKDGNYIHPETFF